MRQRGARLHDEARRGTVRHSIAKRAIGGKVGQFEPKWGEVRQIEVNRKVKLSENGGQDEAR